MKIRAVTPIITESFGPMILEEFSRVARDDTEISNVFLDSGPASVESAYDEAVAIPDVTAKVREAEKEGIDAVIINCFGDPGLDAAREVVSIPVIGPCEAAMHVAAMLGHKFSVVTVLERLIPELELHAEKYGVGWKLASARSIDLPVLDLEKGRDQFVARMVDQAAEAIEKDGAHVIVLGCTGLAGLDQQVENGLREKGHDVPVIDPASIALKIAEALVDAKLAHSKRTYPFPPAKEIVGYP
ncbi:MAG: AroM family protein [Anaerolineae bacterium]